MVEKKRTALGGQEGTRTIRITMLQLISEPSENDPPWLLRLKAERRERDPGRVWPNSADNLQLLEMELEPPAESESRSKEVLLGQLVILLAEAEFLKERTQAVVQHAREQGATWVEIGEAVGIRPQTAYQRWTDKGKENHRQHQRKQRLG